MITRLEDLNSAVENSGNNAYVKAFVQAVNYLMENGKDNFHILQKDTPIPTQN